MFSDDDNSTHSEYSLVLPPSICVCLPCSPSVPDNTSRNPPNVPKTGRSASLHELQSNFARHVEETDQTISTLVADGLQQRSERTAAETRETLVLLNGDVSTLQAGMERMEGRMEKWGGKLQAVVGTVTAVVKELKESKGGKSSGGSAANGAVVGRNSSDGGGSMAGERSSRYAVTK